MQNTLLIIGAAVIAALLGFAAIARTQDDAQTIAAMDTQYQAAVERGDWQTMDGILHADFALVLGNGTTYDRNRLLDSARNATVVFEKQVELPGTQVVRMYGKDAATVTALLWVKGKRNDDHSSFDYKLWFTDTYVRTREGWKYAFGQASLPLPKE